MLVVVACSLFVLVDWYSLGVVNCVWVVGWACGGCCLVRGVRCVLRVACCLVFAGCCLLHAANWSLPALYPVLFDMRSRWRLCVVRCVMRIVLVCGVCCVLFCMCCVGCIMRCLVCVACCCLLRNGCKL